MSHPAGSRLTLRRPDGILAILVCCAAAYVFWDVDRPFNETDEFLYSGVVSHMVDSGDYLTPRFGPIELFTKPPLFYWMGAAVQSATGSTKMGIRLVPGISFLLILCVLYRVGREHFSAEAGLLTALIFFLGYDHLFHHVYKSGVMEGLLNLQIAIVFWLNLQLKAYPGRIRWIAIVIGLAFLTKSVFAVIPVVLTAAHLWFRRHELRVTARHLWQACLLMLAVVLPWFVLVVREHGVQVLDYMFVDQVWKRALNDEAAAAATGRVFGREQSFYVIRHFLEYGHPWSLFAWPALWFAIRSRIYCDARQSLVLRLCAGWFIGVMLLFLLSRGRWSWYVSSVYAPTAIMTGAMFDAFRRDPELRLAPIIWALAGLALYVPSVIFSVNPFDASSGRAPLYLEFADVLLAAMAFGLVVLLAWRRGDGVSVARSEVKWRVTAAVASTCLLAAGYLSLGHSDAPGASFTDLSNAGLVMTSAMLFALVAVRSHESARIAGLTWPFIGAAICLIAPLKWSGEVHRRSEITMVEERIADNGFQRADVVEFRGMSLFAFIPVYATFGADYEVKYDAPGRTIRISRKPLIEPVAPAPP